MGRTLTALTIVGTTLAACTPLQTYYKAGTTVSDLERQTTDCEVSALAKVPPSMQVRVTPPRYVPSRQVCNANGQCQDVGGFFEYGDPYTVDGNVDLRRRVELQCMAEKGFAPVAIPLCPGNVARAAPRRATITLPELNSQSCAIRNSDGSYQIVTRG